MDKLVTGDLYRAFRDPKHLFQGLSADAAALLTASGADIALVLTADGTIENVAYSDRDIEPYGLDSWIGRRWADTVTIESREKIEAMLADAAKAARTRARQVNHPAGGRADLPVSYTLISPPDIPHKIAFGQNLRSMAEMQQRLVNVQLEMEEDYRRIRDAESRYRLLFQLAFEPLIVADAATGKISDINEAGCAFFDRPAKKLIGAGFLSLLSKSCLSDVQQIFGDIRMRGRPESVEAEFADSGQRRMVYLAPFRESGRTSLLIRIADVTGRAARDDRPELESLHSFYQHQPDGVVLVDKEGRIVTANNSFLEQIRVVNLERIASKKLDNWLGGSFVDLQVLMSNLREHASVRRFSTVVRDELGGTTPVEVSATHLPNNEDAAYGFTIRDVPRQETTPNAIRQTDHSYSLAQFSELVGRVPLKELVRDTADIIEKMCIEAALRLTDNNRASAADMLGLSRQSLYLKLRRYDIADFNPEDDEDS